MTADRQFDDPFLSSAGSWGQSYRDLWGLDAIDAATAWDRSLGEGVVVAVVDTGLDDLHPDILGNVWVNAGEDIDGDGAATAFDLNGVDDDGNGFIDDVHGYDFAGYADALARGDLVPGDPDPFDLNGHGTHVAGTIAAVAGNGEGIAGVAPRAEIMPVKVFPATGPASTADVWAGVLYAAMNGAHVVNASFSCGAPCPENPLARRTVAALEDMGVVFVTSAGNASTDVVQRAPENVRTPIVVGAHDVDGGRFGGSNSGWLMDVLAPGAGAPRDPGVLVAARSILSLRASMERPQDEAFAVTPDYGRKFGTSMSAPHVSGAIALLLADRPDLTPEQVRRLLELAARRADGAGHDPDVGAGALDAARLLETELPHALLEIVDPLPGTRIDAASGPVLPIHVQADGESITALDVGYAIGLSGRTFAEIARRDGGPPGAGEASSSWRVEWPIEDLPAGVYALRVRAFLRDGRRLEEFTIVGLERASPVRLSDAESRASTPDVDAGRVFWLQEGERSVDGIRETQIATARFGRRDAAGATEYGSRDEAGGNRRAPRILFSTTDPIEHLDADRRRLAWSVPTSPEDDEARIETCEIPRPGRKGRERVCHGEVVDRLTTSPSALFLDGEFLVWTEIVDSVKRVAACRFSRAGRCDPLDLSRVNATRPSRVYDVDGGAVFWIGTSPEGRRALAYCILPSRDGVCEPIFVRVAENPLVPHRLAIDRDLLVFSFLVPNADASLVYCQLDIVTGVCSIENAGVAGVISRDATPVVSGRWIAWRAPRADAFSALEYCELDPDWGACRPQRVTGVPARVAEPTLDGPHLSWVDERFDARAILGLALPRVELPARSKLRAGTTGSLRFVTRGLDRKTLELALEPIDVPDPDRWRIRVGPGRIRMRPPRNGAGLHVWELIATDARGLETRARLEVRVEAPRRAGRVLPARPSLWHWLQQWMARWSVPPRSEA